MEDVMEMMQSTVCHDGATATNTDIVREGGGFKVGFTASCFDLLHAGHILLLKEMKERCTYVVVALQTDPTIDRPHKNKPVQSFEERRIQIEGVKYVDFVVEYTTEAELETIVSQLAWFVNTTFNQRLYRFLGDDYIGTRYTGDTIEGVVVRFVDRDHGLSTSNLRNKVYIHERQRRIGK